MRLLPLIFFMLAGSLVAGELTAYPLWDGQESVADYAKRVNLPPTKTLELGNGVKLELVLIPAEKFVMGTPEPVGQAKERREGSEHPAAEARSAVRPRFADHPHRNSISVPPQNSLSNSSSSVLFDMRTPFTKVPLLLPRSSTKNLLPSSVDMTAQCRRDRVSSSSARSASLSLPMTSILPDCNAMLLPRYCPATKTSLAAVDSLWNIASDPVSALMCVSPHTRTVGCCKQPQDRIN